MPPKYCLILRLFFQATKEAIPISPIRQIVGRIIKSSSIPLSFWSAVGEFEVPLSSVGEFEVPLSNNDIVVSNRTV